MRQWWCNRRACATENFIIFLFFFLLCSSWWNDFKRLYCCCFIYTKIKAFFFCYIFTVKYTHFLIPYSPAYASPPPPTSPRFHTNNFKSIVIIQIQTPDVLYYTHLDWSFYLLTRLRFSSIAFLSCICFLIRRVRREKDNNFDQIIRIKSNFIVILKTVYFKRFDEMMWMMMMMYLFAYK